MFTIKTDEGWIQKGEEVFIYCASSGTRMHVVPFPIERLLDDMKNTPSDPLTSRGCVDQRMELMEKNSSFL